MPRTEVLHVGVDESVVVVATDVGKALLQGGSECGRFVTLISRGLRRPRRHAEQKLRHMVEEALRALSGRRPGGGNCKGCGGKKHLLKGVGGLLVVSPWDPKGRDHG